MFENHKKRVDGRESSSSRADVELSEVSNSHLMEVSLKEKPLRSQRKKENIEKLLRMQKKENRREDRTIKESEHKELLSLQRKPFLDSNKNYSNFEERILKNKSNEHLTVKGKFMKIQHNLLNDDENSNVLLSQPQIFFSDQHRPKRSKKNHLKKKSTHNTIKIKSAERKKAEPTKTINFNKTEKQINNSKNNQYSDLLESITSENTFYSSQEKIHPLTSIAESSSMNIHSTIYRSLLNTFQTGAINDSPLNIANHSSRYTNGQSDRKNSLKYFSTNCKASTGLHSHLLSDPYSFNCPYSKDLKGLRAFSCPNLVISGLRHKKDAVYAQSKNMHMRKHKKCIFNAICKEESAKSKKRALRNSATNILMSFFNNSCSKINKAQFTHRNNGQSEQYMGVEKLKDLFTPKTNNKSIRKTDCRFMDLNNSHSNKNTERKNHINFQEINKKASKSNENVCLSQQPQASANLTPLTFSKSEQAERLVQNSKQNHNILSKDFYTNKNQDLHTSIYPGAQISQENNISNTQPTVSFIDTSSNQLTRQSGNYLYQFQPSRIEPLQSSKATSDSSLLKNAPVFTHNLSSKPSSNVFGSHTTTSGPIFTKTIQSTSSNQNGFYSGTIMSSLNDNKAIFSQNVPLNSSNQTNLKNSLFSDSNSKNSLFPEQASNADSKRPLFSFKQSNYNNMNKNTSSSSKISNLTSETSFKPVCDFKACSIRIILKEKCKFCEKMYCGKHRIPEEHLCENLSKWKEEYKNKNTEKLMNEKCSGKKL